MSEKEEGLKFPCFPENQITTEEVAQYISTDKALKAYPSDWTAVTFSPVPYPPRIVTSDNILPPLPQFVTWDNKVIQAGLEATKRQLEQEFVDQTDELRWESIQLRKEVRALKSFYSLAAHSFKQVAGISGTCGSCAQLKDSLIHCSLEEVIERGS